MSSGDLNLEEHTISRYCPPTKLKEDGAPSGQAFSLRLDRNELELSCNWLEYFNDLTKEEQIDSIRNTIGLKLAKRGKFAISNIKKFIDYVHEESPKGTILDIIHSPIGADVSHSLILKIADDPEIISELLADIFTECYPAKI